MPQGEAHDGCLDKIILHIELDLSLIMLYCSVNL